MKQAGLPNIEGTLYPDGQANESGRYSAPDLQKGCFKGRNNTSAIYNSGRSGVSGAIEIAFSASYSNTIYGSSNTVQPPAICLVPQIRY